MFFAILDMKCEFGVEMQVDIFSIGSPKEINFGGGNVNMELLKSGGSPCS